MTEYDRLSADQKYLHRLTPDNLNADQQLIVAAQRGQSLLVSSLLQSGAKVTVDQVI